ncbi:MAG: 2-dehydro-3-deoxygalactonokinase [Rhodobacteraceae bacterium]|nr:2-dehydro-3-deoxygalactonokinase [Paracoccaceae bacterium]
MTRQLIGVDWGTSNVRAWLIADGRPIAQSQSTQGMSRIMASEYPRALARMIEPWLSGAASRNVIACGMLGAAQGWVEARYRTVPCKPVAPGELTAIATELRDCTVHIIPGIRQFKPMADVMRGEETQVAGFCVDNPHFDGVLCLPGTHTKWVHVSAGEIVSFRSFMTGELYDLLCRHSLLRHSVSSNEFCPDEFREAAGDQLSQPELLAARLFAIRAESLIAGLEAARAGSRLAGFLVGAELAASRPYWLGHRIAIIGAPRLAQSYEMALDIVGQKPLLADSERCTVAGLTHAHSLCLNFP